MKKETLAPHPPAGILRPYLLFSFVTAYAGAIVLGNLFYVTDNNVPAFWPGSGLFLAALLLVRRQAWPVLLLAGFFTQIAVDMLAYSYPIGVAGSFAAANSLEALVGAYLTQRLTGQRIGLENVEQLLRMIAAAVVIAPMFCAAIGTMAVSLISPAVEFAAVWRVWWTADALGVLLVAPPLLAFGWRRQQRPIFQFSPRMLEAVILMILVGALIQFILEAEPDSLQLALDLPYMIFPFLIWASFRLDPRQITAILFLMSMLLLWNAGQGRGPFMGLELSASAQVLSLQAFIAVAVLTTLILSTVVRAGNRRRDALRTREQELAEAQRIGQLGHWRTRFSGPYYESSDQLWRLYGLEPTSGGLSYEAVDEMVVPDDRERTVGERRAALERLEPYVLNFRIKRKDGAIRHLTVRAYPESDTNGAVVGYFGITQDVTHQKRAEEALKERDHLFRRAEKMGRLGHYIHDYQARKTYWSDNMFEIHGLDRAGLPQFDPERGSRVADPDEAERFLGPRREAIKRGEPGYTYTTFVIRPDDGTRCDIYGECSFDYDGKGELRAIFGVVKDVTEELEALRTLRQREEELAEAQRIGHIGHWRIPADTWIAEWSDELWRICGLEPGSAELTREFTTGLIHPDDRATVLEFRLKTEQEPAPYSLNYRIVRPDGEIRYVEVRIQPETDSAGRLVSYFGVTHDITEQKRAAEELQDRERWLSTIVSALDHGSFGLTMQDEGGKIVYANKSVAKIGGFGDPKELVGKTWLDLSHSQDIEFKHTMLAARKEAFDRGYSCVDFDWARICDEEIRRVEARSAPAPGGGLIVLFLDITEQRAQEERHKQLQAGMREWQKMEAVGQLAGGTAHEINNLLHPIITFARLSQDKTDDPELREYQADILECSRKAAKIVSDILIFARRSSGDRQVIDAIELAERAVRFAEDISAPAIDIVSRVTAKNAFVKVNETEFIQVILNLVKNASDAMEGRGVILLGYETVTLDRAEAAQHAMAPGAFLRVSIQDNGKGIASSDLTRIFEPFFTTKDIGRGTGLGLSVVYGIVKDWGGGIDVESQLGQGALFQVFIPIADVAERAEEPRSNE